MFKNQSSYHLKFPTTVYTSSGTRNSYVCAQFGTPSKLVTKSRPSTTYNPPIKRWLLNADVQFYFHGFCDQLSGSGTTVPKTNFVPTLISFFLDSKFQHGIPLLTFNLLDKRIIGILTCISPFLTVL